MTPEGKVEAYLVKRVKAAGGFVRKVKWIGRSSAPDRYVSLPGWQGFIELKRPGKWTTAAQQREHVRMRAAGTATWVLNSEHMVDVFMDMIAR